MVVQTRAAEDLRTVNDWNVYLSRAKLGFLKPLNRYPPNSCVWLLSGRISQRQTKRQVNEKEVSVKVLAMLATVPGPKPSNLCQRGE